MNQIGYPPDWYSAAQAGICLFSAILIFTLWQRALPGKEREPNEDAWLQRDPGMLYLGLAVLVWGLIALGMLLKACPSDWPLRECFPSLMASTLSHSCLLLASAYFEFGPIELKIAQDDWKWHVGVMFAAMLVALLVLFTQSAWPDFILAAATLAIVGMSAFLSFKAHGFHATAYLALPIAALAALVQLAETIEGQSLSFLLAGERFWILRLTSKALLVVLFLIMCISWLYGKLAPSPTEELRLEFLGKDEFKNSWLVRFSVPNVFSEKRIELPPVLHQILLTFATERLLREAQTEGWINIKNKYYPSDLSRICKKLEVPTVRLFENDANGGYRLRVPRENIKLHKQSFAKYPELMSLLKDVKL
jgi:hypothetical protein